MMHLEIIHPLKREIHTIAWLEINTSHGNFIIQPDHAPTILVLSPNSTFTFCLSSGKQESVTIERGIAEITRKNITILISQ